jgi:hypothetical protein
MTPIDPNLQSLTQLNNWDQENFGVKKQSIPSDSFCSP